MFANKVNLNTIIKRISPASIGQVAAAHDVGGFHDERFVIGKREWVGYGANSMPHYADKIGIPLPAVRFKEITGDLVGLKEKEKSDWKNLSLEEKKKLYRASFRQTFSERYAPTGEWKSTLGWTLFFASLGLWVYIIETKFIYKPLPSSFSEESRAAQLQRMIDNKVGHLTGLATKWDYEKNDWKK